MIKKKDVEQLMPQLKDALLKAIKNKQHVEVIATRGIRAVPIHVTNDTMMEHYQHDGDLEIRITIAPLPERKLNARYLEGVKKGEYDL